MAFAKIRGPIGGPREDAYALMQAWYASGPHEEKAAKKVSAESFVPWAFTNVKG
jgi:hypothetical protein